MSRLVALDTMILGWGIRKEATAGQDVMVARAERFLKWLDETDARVIVPSVVLAEYLIPVPADRHPDAVAALRRAVIIAPFDALAAARYAQIWQDQQRPEDTPRAKWKADLMILATALARRASMLYTHDDDLTKVAARYIAVQHMPLLEGKQLPLFAVMSAAPQATKSQPK